MLEGLYKKGYITEETFNKGLKKYSDGGTVTPILQQDQAAPQSTPAPSVAPEILDAAKKAQDNTVMQAQKSPFSFMSDEQWAALPPEQKLMATNPALARETLPSSARSMLSKLGQFIQEKRAEGLQREQEQLQQAGIAPTPEQQVVASDIAKTVGQEVKPAGDMIQVPKEVKPSPYEGIAKGYDDAFTAMQKGIEAEAAAGARQASAMTSAYATAVNDLQNFQKDQKILEQTRRDQLQAQAQRMEQSIDEFKKASVLDPNKFWANKTTGDKIMASVAVFLGGLGGGPNQALEIINNAVTRDIEAQKQAAMGAKGKYEMENNIYRNMMDQFQNETAAFTASRLAALNIAEMQIKKAEASTANLQAKARSQQALGQLGLQKVKLQQELLSQVQNSPQALAADQETKAIMRLPENLRKDAFKELGEYRQIQQNIQSASRTMDELNQVSALGRLSPVDRDRIDTLKASLIPKIKSVLGEAMQEADVKRMVDPLIPSVGESDAARKRKKETFLKMLEDAVPGKTPTLSGMGIIKTQKPFSFQRND